MRKYIICSNFMAGLFAYLLSPGIMHAGNLVRNPGFEASSGIAQEWIITGPIPAMQPVFSIDSRNSFSGGHGLMMESKNPNCYGRAFQNVAITGGQTYLFSASFRAENVKSIDKCVLIRVKWFRDQEQLGYNYIYTYSGKTKGWYHASDKILAIAGSTSAEISLEFRWSTGTVWWDDISLEAGTPEPARNVKVGTLYFRPPGSTVKENIDLMGKMLDQAGNEGCGIVCYPRDGPPATPAWE